MNGGRAIRRASFFYPLLFESVGGVADPADGVGDAVYRSMQRALDGFHFDLLVA
jgi:hypothetical protein